jgi:hypothetical protein
MPEVAAATAAEHGPGCKCRCKSSSKVGPSAREILDRRYASGEITRDQYEQIKHDLGGTSMPTPKNACC